MQTTSSTPVFPYNYPLALLQTILAEDPHRLPQEALHSYAAIDAWFTRLIRSY